MLEWEELLDGGGAQERGFTELFPLRSAGRSDGSFSLAFHGIFMPFPSAVLFDERIY